jgi:hypothetical protein
VAESNAFPFNQPDSPLGKLLWESRESAARREPLTDQEKEVILACAERLKLLGHSAAELLAKMYCAEAVLRTKLQIDVKDDRWPVIEKLTPLLAEARSKCPWPASDFVYSPSVVNWLGFLRQWSDAWVRSGSQHTRPVPEDPERQLWDPGISDLLWKLRLLVGTNMASEHRWANKRQLDQLVEALRLNTHRPGRHAVGVNDFMVEWRLFILNRAFHGILRRAQREVPRRVLDEQGIKEALVERNYPSLLVERLAQELHEHRQRHEAGGLKITLEDRAALLSVELEGKRDRYGLPEPFSPSEAVADNYDVSQPIIVATRRPAPGPFRNRAEEERYEAAFLRAVERARGRVRRLRAIWNSGADPKSEQK